MCHSMLILIHYESGWCFMMKVYINEQPAYELINNLMSTLSDTVSFLLANNVIICRTYTVYMMYCIYGK